MRNVSAQLPLSFLCSLELQPMDWCHPCLGGYGGWKRMSDHPGAVVTGYCDLLNMDAGNSGPLQE